MIMKVLLSSKKQRAPHKVLTPIIHTAACCDPGKEKMMLVMIKTHKCVSVSEDADFPPITSSSSRWSSAGLLS